MPHAIVTSDVKLKELALILMKVIRQREEVLGHSIVLSPEFYKISGVAPEDGF